MPCCPFYYQVSVHNRGDAYSILESDAKGRCRYGCCRRNYSLLQQRKLVSDAEGRCRYDRCRRNYSSLRPRKLESDAEVRCRYGFCRQNYSSLPLRKLESDADHLSRNDSCRRAIPHCCDDGAAVIRKSGPEIKNRCSNEAVSGQSVQ